MKVIFSITSCLYGSSFFCPSAVNTIHGFNACSQIIWKSIECRGMWSDEDYMMHHQVHWIQMSPNFRTNNMNQTKYIHICCHQSCLVHPTSYLIVGRIIIWHSEVMNCADTDDGLQHLGRERIGKSRQNHIRMWIVNDNIFIFNKLNLESRYLRSKTNMCQWSFLYFWRKVGRLNSLFQSFLHFWTKVARLNSSLHGTSDSSAT